MLYMSREHKKQIHAFRQQSVCSKNEIFVKGWWLLQKKGEKVDKIDMMKNPPLPIFFFIERGYFDQKLPGESDKNGPDALQRRFLA